jgi:kynurenine formamidase
MRTGIDAQMNTFNHQIEGGMTVADIPLESLVRSIVVIKVEKRFMRPIKLVIWALRILDKLIELSFLVLLQFFTQDKESVGIGRIS